MLAIDDDPVTPGRAGPAEGRLSRGDGVAVWRQIADTLAAEIGTGRLPPGNRTPTEAALSARFGVNRHTVRRALAVLARQGLIRTTRGSGTFVAGPLTYPIGSRTRFSEIVARTGREALGELLGESTGPADPGTARALALPEAAPVLQLTTLHRADGTPISTARTVLPLPRFAGFGDSYATTGSITRALASFGCADYRRQSTRITARLASPDEAVRLGLGGSAVVLAVDSVNVDRDGAPIQATRAVFASERVEFLIES